MNRRRPFPGTRVAAVDDAGTVVSLEPRRNAVIQTMLNRMVVFGFIGLWMLASCGCVKQSEYDAKVATLKSQAEKLTKAEETASQLQKDLDEAKSKIATSEQTAKDAQTKVTTLEQEITDLKAQVEKLPQLQKDFDAAKAEAKTSAQAAKDAQAKVTTLDQENANLKEQAAKLAEAEKKVEQLQKELDAAKKPAPPTP
jgi:DNA repair exonuclease SbcCD ATPase subunit